MTAGAACALVTMSAAWFGLIAQPVGASAELADQSWRMDATALPAFQLVKCSLIWGPCASHIFMYCNHLVVFYLD